MCGVWCVMCGVWCVMCDVFFCWWCVRVWCVFSSVVCAPPRVCAPAYVCVCVCVRTKRVCCEVYVHLSVCALCAVCCVLQECHTTTRPPGLTSRNFSSSLYTRFRIRPCSFCSSEENSLHTGEGREGKEHTHHTENRKGVKCPPGHELIQHT